MSNHSSAPDTLTSARASRLLGSLALLVVGGIHLEQYEVAHFSVVPTIGPLFLANFIGATLCGLILLFPLGAGAGARRLVFDSVVALSGLAIAAGAFIALLISEHTPLFGFMEVGYRTEIVIALVAEAVAVISLAVYLASMARYRRRVSTRFYTQTSEV